MKGLLARNRLVLHNPNLQQFIVRIASKYKRAL